MSANINPKSWGSEHFDVSALITNEVNPKAMGKVLGIVYRSRLFFHTCECRLLAEAV
jgi:hypothetical protein